MKNSRWIFQTMILSLGLNVALVGVFFYFLIQNNPLHFSYRPKEEIKDKHPPVPSSFLGRLPAVSCEHLIALLEDRRKMEHGYQVREVALGALAAYHDFDVERALGRGKLSKQIWKFEDSKFILFPGLSEEDFETLITFAATEQWPFTTHGLFTKIEQTGIEKCDPALLSFFCHTPEFVLVETLFVRTHLPIQKRNVLNLILEGGWDQFAAFAEAQEKGVDFSEEIRRQFLIGAIDHKSKTAAYLLLLTDSTFAVQQLDDAHLAAVLDLLTVKTQESLQFAQAVAASGRIGPVKEKAMIRMSEYMGNIYTPPQGEVAGHFVEKPVQKDLRPVFRQAPPAAPAPGTHVVQDGESLWIIARKYKISTEALMEANQLQSSVIRPGKTLKIPRA